MQAPDELTLFAARLEQVGAPYMVTGATAAILYGQPRVTNDLDVVLSLNDATRRALLTAFPESDFYVPPEEVIRAEQARPHRGHFNIVHLESGYKADIYLVGDDPLHIWALQHIRRVPWSEHGLALSVAPPEYVVVRKLEFYREGGSSKHVSDIAAICEITGVDDRIMKDWLDRKGLTQVWHQVRSSKGG